METLNWICPHCKIVYKQDRGSNATHFMGCQKPIYNIGLLLIATGKYDVFVKPVIESAREFLFTNHHVTFFVFTDHLELGELGDDVVIIPHEHKPWPMPTLLRYNTFLKHSDKLAGMDYLYYSDVDMRFVDIVGDEAIGDRVATMHPGYVGGVGTPERRPESTAYLPLGTSNRYFAGGFNGGSRKSFLEMSRVIDENIEKDRISNIIAIWHDESHMNKYFFDNPPTVILDAGYCYGESMNLPYKKRLLALNKNHDFMRSE